MSGYEWLSNTKLGYYVTNDAVFFKPTKSISSDKTFTVIACDIGSLTNDDLGSYAMTKNDAFNLATALNCKVLVRTISSSFREIK